MGPYQVLPLWGRVDLGVIAINGHSAFSKAPALLETRYQIVYCHMQDSRWGKTYPFAEMQLVYSIAPADGAIALLEWFRLDSVRLRYFI